MVSTTGFGLFSDFSLIHKWAGEMWAGHYTGLYPFPLMVLLAPLSRLPVDVAAGAWFVASLAILVWMLRRSALYWILFVPFLQSTFLGQLDPLFWLIYRSRRPAVWALLSLKPQLLLPALPGIFSSRRNFAEFVAATLALHVPFLLIRPTWPAEWLDFLAHYQNRLGEITRSTVSGEIVLSAGVVPYVLLLAVLVYLRRKNAEAGLFLINPLLLPYDQMLLMGAVSRIAIPLSWLALAAAWRFQAGWPYAVMTLCVLAFETYRERRKVSAAKAPAGR